MKREREREKLIQASHCSYPCLFARRSLSDPDVRVPSLPFPFPFSSLSLPSLPLFPSLAILSRVVVGEGKKREVRALVANAGLKVDALKRVRVGQLWLHDLPIGQFRGLSPKERELATRKDV